MESKTMNKKEKRGKFSAVRIFLYREIEENEPEKRSYTYEATGADQDLIRLLDDLCLARLYYCRAKDDKKAGFYISRKGKDNLPLFTLCERIPSEDTAQYACASIEFSAIGELLRKEEDLAGIILNYTVLHITRNKERLLEALEKGKRDVTERWGLYEGNGIKGRVILGISDQPKMDIS